MQINKSNWRVFFVFLFVITVSCREGGDKFNTIDEKLVVIENSISQDSKDCSITFRRNYFGDREMNFTRYGYNGEYAPICVVMDKSNCEAIVLRKKYFPDSLLLPESIIRTISNVACRLNLKLLECDKSGNTYVGFSDAEKPDYAFLNSSNHLDSNYSYTKYKMGWWKVD